MRSRWKHITATLAIILVFGSLFVWWIRGVARDFVLIDTIQVTESDFANHQEQVEFLSDLTALEVPTTATEITFTKDGWQDHWVVGRFHIAQNDVAPFIDSIPNAKEDQAGVYHYNTDDDRIVGTLSVDPATGWIEVDAGSN